MSHLTVEQDYSGYMARIENAGYSRFSAKSERDNCIRCAREAARQTKAEYSVLLYHLKLSNEDKWPVRREYALKSTFARLNTARARMVDAYKLRRWLLRQIRNNPHFSVEWDVKGREMARNATRRENMPKPAYPSAWAPKGAEKPGR